MKPNHVILVIMLGFSLGLRAETPDVESIEKKSSGFDHVKDANPDSKTFQTSSEVEGEEKSYEVEGEARRNYIYPSNFGTAGIFRVRSAESLPKGTVTFGIGGDFYSTSNVPADIQVRYPGNVRTISESIFIGYAPTEELTLGVMRKSSSTTLGTPQQLISSLGDFNFSGMYSFPVNQSFAIAPVVNFLIASNFNDLAPTGQTLSVGAGLTATFGLEPTLNIPLFLHANLIYHMPQLRTSKTQTTIDPETFFNFSRYHTVTLGLGAEFKLGDFIPFLEFQQVAQTDSGLSYTNSPSRLTAGARITPLENKGFSVLLGTDVGLGRRVIAGVPFTPQFGVVGQISYTFGITQTERKHYYTTKDVNVVDRKFVLDKSIKFKVNKTELDPVSNELLDQIAEVIKQNNVKKLLITGHTDSTHNEDYNLRLSLGRANAVKTYLTSRGVSNDVMSTQGYGKRKPRASNLHETGRQENRRVEFFILE